MADAKQINIDKPKEESDDSYSNDDLFKISSWGADLSFRELIARYDDEAQPYRSRETMERLSDVRDYDHLARVREWSLIGEGGE